MESATLKVIPAVWYWSEHASGYSIEDCEQIVAQELKNMNDSK